MVDRFLRAYYSFDETMQLALDGINAYKNWSDYTELGNETEAFFTETGALWMLGKSSLENQAMQTRLESFGVESVVMDEHHVSHVFPALSTLAYPKIDYETGEIVQDDFGTFSSLFEAGCGHMDSSACLRDMQKACVRVELKYAWDAELRGCLAVPCQKSTVLSCKTGNKFKQALRLTV